MAAQIPGILGAVQPDIEIVIYYRFARVSVSMLFLVVHVLCVSLVKARPKKF